MGTATLRPSADATVQGGTCVNALVPVPATPTFNTAMWTNMQDNLDTTFLENRGGQYTCGLGMTSTTLPLRAQVRSATLRLRCDDATATGYLGTATIYFGSKATVTAGPSGLVGGALGSVVPVARTNVVYNTASLDPASGVGQADVDGIEVFWFNQSTLPPVSTPGPRFYELWLDLVYNEAPVVTVTAPAATVTTTTRPTIVASYTDPENDTLDQYRVKVFTAAQASIVGFDPETSPSTWDSGVVTPATTIVSGGSISQQVGIDLPNNTTYVAYVKAADVGSAMRYSAWAASASFLLSVTPPAAPSIVATPDSVLNRVALALLGFDNELTRNQANGETSVTGWFPVTNVASTQVFADGVTATNTTLTSATAAFTANDVGITVTGAGIPGGTTIKTVNSATSVTLSAATTATASGVSITLGRVWPRRQTTQVLQGAGAFVMRAAASGTAAVRSVSAATTAAILKEAIPVKPSTQYTALVSFRQAAVAAGRTGRVDIAWYDATGTIISTGTGSAVALTSTTWTSQQSFLTATSPVNAAFAVLIVNVLGGTVANEDTYFDQVSLAPGSSTTWTRGGLVQAVGPGSDTFTRVDSAVSLGTADVGGAWTAGRGTWGIQTNQAYMATGTTGTIPFAYMTLPEFVDGTVTVDLKLSAVRSDVILFMRMRTQSALAYTLPDCLCAQITVSATANQLNLFTVYNGTAPTQIVTAASLTLGSTVGIKMEAVGDRANLYFDRKDGKGFQKAASITLSAADIAAMSGNDDAVGAGFGINYLSTGPSGDDATVRFDNFVAQPLVAPQKIIVERSADAGVTWQQVRSGYLVDLTDPGQFGTFYDYEAPRGAQVLWRAKVQVTEITDVLSSPYSATSAATLASDGNAWLKSPSDPTKNVAVVLAKDSVSSKSHEDLTIFEPLGRADPLIHGGTIRLEEFDGLEFFCLNDAAWVAFEALRARREPLLLQTCYGDSTALDEQFWVRLGADRSVSRLTMSTSTGQLRRVRIPARQVAVPVVP